MKVEKVIDELLNLNKNKNIIIRTDCPECEDYYDITEGYSTWVIEEEEHAIVFRCEAGYCGDENFFGNSDPKISRKTSYEIDRHILALETTLNYLKLMKQNMEEE